MNTYEDFLNKKHGLYEITVVTESKQKIEFLFNQIFVYVKSKPQNNRANEEIIKMIEKTFSTNENSANVKILAGFNQRKKVIKIY